MRISDWSSDVCSSDLGAAFVAADSRGGGSGARELGITAEVGAGEACEPGRPVLTGQRVGELVADVPRGEHRAEPTDGEEGLRLLLGPVLREGLAEVVELSRLALGEQRGKAAAHDVPALEELGGLGEDRKSTRLNSSH